MERRNIAGHSPLEPVFGYSRAVRTGNTVYVSGTAPILEDGSDPPTDSYEQMKVCLEIVAGALQQAGARLEDVVRTRIYLTPEADFEGVARAHGEAFGEIRPACAAVVITSLLDPRWLVEIEAEAVIAPLADR